MINISSIIMVNMPITFVSLVNQKFKKAAIPIQGHGKFKFFSMNLSSWLS